MDQRNTLAYDDHRGAALILIKPLGEFYGHD